MSRHEELVRAAADAIEAVFDDASVPEVETVASLELLAELIEERLDDLHDPDPDDADEEDDD